MPTAKSKQTYYTVFIDGKAHDVTGRKRNHAGYVALCIKSHPNSDVQGYVMEHRVVMEVQLGRYLEKDEVVHHENEVKHDNRISNLKLMKHAEHTVMHHVGSKRSESTKMKMSIWAKERMKDKRNHPSYKDVDSELVELYKRGKYPTEISKILGISRKAVYNKIEYLNLKERVKHVK